MAEIGRAKCGTCSEVIPVKTSAGGALNLSCPWCGVSKYAKKGEKAHALEMARVTLTTAPPAESKPAKPAGKDAPPPKPAAEKPAKEKMPWE